MSEWSSSRQCLMKLRNFPQSELREAVLTERADRYDRQVVLDKIESIFENMADVLLNERGDLCIELQRRFRHGKLQTLMVEVDSDSANATKRIGFPGKTEREAWEFSKSAVSLRRWHKTLISHASCGHSHTGDDA